MWTDGTKVELEEDGGRSRRQFTYTNKTHHDCDGFAVADKVPLRLPTVLVSTLDDLSRWTGVVHGVRRDEVLTVRRPVQTQDVRCTTTLHDTSPK